MAVDPELLAEAQRRGLSPKPAPKPAVDPELVAEAQRRGIPAAPAASGANGTYTGGAYQPYSGAPDDSTMSDILTNTPIGRAIGKAGKWANDKIQNSIGNQVEAVGKNFPSESPVDKITRMAASAYGALPAGASEYLSPKSSQEASGMMMPTPGGAQLDALSGAAGDVARGAGGLAEGAVEQSSKLFSKTTPQAFEMLRQDPEGVLAAARKGMGLNALTQASEPIALQDAQAAGRGAQGIIDKSAEGAGKEYGQMMEHLKGDKGTDKFSVAEKVYDKMEPFINSQTSYRSATRTPGVASDAETFNHFYDRIKATQAEGMAPGEAADLLEQMTREQKAARGMPLSAHLAELKNSLLDALPGDYKIPTIDTPTPGGWSIKDTRAGYKAAKDLQRETAPFTTPQNPIAALRSVARAGGDASVSLKNAIEKIPALKAAIESMNVNAAGAEFAPKFKTPPGTGLTGGVLGIAASKALLGNPVAAGELGLSALGMSPRATAETLVAGRNAGSAIMNSARGAEGKLPALLAALLRRKQQEPQP